VGGTVYDKANVCCINQQTGVKRTNEPIVETKRNELQKGKLNIAEGKIDTHLIIHLLW
jgi:hypothetical protein